jgi:2-methylisocitrate lyase-like PEP mutase family enzyme
MLGAAAFDLAEERARALRALLAEPGPLVLPGVFDGPSALLAKEAGFPALYLTGYGVSASAYGLPDAGLIGLGEMSERLAALARRVPLPFLADADTGYGGLLNVAHTVRRYAEAGAAGLQIEDQEFPKKCGHTPHRRVVPRETATRRVAVAVEAAREAGGLVVVARTDAAGAMSLDEALFRGEAFLEAGADVLFIESPRRAEDLARIGQAFRGAVLLANMVEGGRTPLLSAEELHGLGFKIALFPISALTAAAEAMRQVYRGLKETGASPDLPRLPFDAMNTLLGFPEVWAFERRWQEVGMEDEDAPGGERQGT